MIKNDKELNAIMRNDLYEVVDEVAQIILEKLKENVGEYIYSHRANPDGYSPLKEDGGFLGSWVVNSLATPKSILANVEQDTESMVLDAEHFIHGSAYKEYYSDVRESLAEIIIEGKSGPIFGEGYWRDKRDFWTPLIQSLDAGEFDSIVRTSFSKRGIRIV